MMINSINSFNNFAYKKQGPKNPKENNVNFTGPNFTGLKSRYKKQIYVSNSHLQALTGVYPRANGRVGELPIEMIKILKTNYPNNLTEKIEETKDAFAACANVLSNADDRKAKIDPEKLLRHYLDLKIEGKHEEAKKMLVAVGTNEIIQSEYMDSVQKEAADVLTKRMRALKILPKDYSAKITYAGYGRFKEGYCLDFVNKDGDSLFGKFVIKMYKDPKRTQRAHQQFLSKLSEFIGSKDYEKMHVEYMRKCPELSLFNEISMAHTYLKQNLSVPEEHREILKDRDGMHPDANAAIFLEGAVGGDIYNTNLIKMYFFDFENNFSLARFSDETLPKPTVEVDLEKFGLMDDDPAEYNILCGRLIDYGSIIPISPDNPINIKTNRDLRLLTTNKTARTTYGNIRRIAQKHSVEQAERTHSELTQKALNNSVPHSKDVLLGLELAKKYVLEEE